MLQTLEHRARLVALEAFHAPDMLGFMGDVVTDVHHAFSGFVDRFSPTTPGLALTGVPQSFLKEITKHSYMGLRAVTAFTPEGLNVPYSQYLAALSPAVDHVARMPEQVLFPFTKFLSGIITNRELGGSSQRIDQPYPDLQAQRTRLLQGIGQCFQTNSSRTERTLADVVARNADWELVLRQADELAQTLNKIDRKVLDKKIRECVELLSAVQRKIQKKDFGSMSSQVANNLSAGTYQVASELEFYSVVFYRLQALLEAMNRSIEHLKFVFTK